MGETAVHADAETSNHGAETAPCSSLDVAWSSPVAAEIPGLCGFGTFVRFTAC